MNILVTGAGGFIGRHLVAVLRERGHRLLVMTRQPASAFNGVEYVATPSICSVDELRRCLRGVDVVVHLAGIAHRSKETFSREYHEELRQVNVNLTEALYRAASDVGVGKFIFLSSIASLTSRNLGRVSDLTSPCPSSMYGESKLAAEKAICTISQSGGVDYMIIRPPVVYGMGNPANMKRLAEIVKSGIPLPLKSVVNRRSFIYVGNLCDIIDRCLYANVARNQTWLVSDGRDMSTPELINQLAVAGGFRCRLFPFSHRILGWVAKKLPDSSIAKIVGSLYCDITPCRDSLNWTPPFTVENGISQIFRDVKAV